MPVPGAFPLVKLAALAIRQVAKPLANVIKIRAKSSPFFRNYICMPPAQFYHWMDVNVKMRMLNLGKPREVQKLDEQAAIELGADLLGETVIFVVAAATLTAEYMRQSRNAAKAAQELEERWSTVESKIHELETAVKFNTEAFNKLSQVLSSTTSKSIDRGTIMNAIKDAKSTFS